MPQDSSDCDTLRKPYTDAEIYKRAVKSDVYLSDGLTAQIKETILKILEAEAPIERGYLFQKVCNSFSVSSSSINILRKTDGLLRSITHKETRFGGSVFVWREDQDPATYFEYRVPNNSQSEGFFAGRVCYEELAALLYDVVLNDSPVDIDLMIDIAIDEMHFSGQRAKSREILTEAFNCVCDCGLLEADDQGDVHIVRDLAQIQAQGTASEKVSRIVYCESREPQVTPDPTPRAPWPKDQPLPGKGAKAAKEPKAPRASRAKQEKEPSSRKAAEKTRVVPDETKGIIAGTTNAQLYVPKAQSEDEHRANIQYEDPSRISELVGAKVIHKQFGEGRIRKIQNGRVLISFAGDVKQFVYPTIFSAGIATIVE